MTTPTRDDLVFLGRRRLRGSGRRAVLSQDLACGPGAAVAALALLRELEQADGVPRLVMGSIPFDPRSPARLVVPERVIEEPRAGRATGRQARGTAPALADDPAYRSAVEQALDAIGAGVIRKVVLARAFDVRAPAPIDTEALLAAFTARNPAAYGFHIPLADGSVIVGASPELVADVEGLAVRSHPLAGTAARRADPDEDHVAHTALLASSKDREEHAILVAGLASDVAPLVTDLHIPAAPAIVEADRLWHLGTRVSGRLRPGVTALDVAYAVHPTAAVCGVPAQEAAALVDALEPEGRGAYGGLVGWMDSSGDGEWALALRCATVTGASARVQAGAGILAGSDPGAEHAETAAKLRTALDALADVTELSPAWLVGA
ncbi:isochorismate synthase [Cellulomonas timonensis]|uniref:isochorismate synthase n=1 Tax=Cellulomonas timonensis TaxID=1689271 RepID=UPI00082B126A|nr:isochorismate synthase [Cellulomonas timonensis]